MRAFLTEFLGRFPPKWVAPLALGASCAIILTALAMEHLGGLQPCLLCYHQRLTYYSAIPLLTLATIVRNPLHIGVLMGVVALCFAIGFFLAGYHLGVEWGIFAGPQACGAAGNLPTTTQDLLQAMDGVRLTPCHIPAWTLFGISLAGYNALACLVLSKLCAWSAGYVWAEGQK